MANEFIARKGLKVLANGVSITGSSYFSTDVTSSGNVKANAFYGDGVNVTGVVSSSYSLTSSLATSNIITASGAGSTITFTKGDGSTFPVTITVGSSATASYVEYTNIANKPALVSSSAQIDHNQTTNYVANQHVDHSTVSITAGSGLNGGGDITATRTLSVNSGSMLPYYSSSIFSAVSGDITITSAGVATIAANSVALGTDTTGNYAADVTAGNGISVGGVAGEGTSFSVTLNTGSAHFTDGVKTKLNAEGVFSSSAQLPAGTVSSSLQFNDLSLPFTGSFTGSFRGDGSNLTGIATSLSIAGTTGTDTVNLKTDTLTFAGGNGVTAAVTDNTITVSIPAGTVSSSAQVDVRNTTGIATIATTGSNTFTGVQTISNTTNSTLFNNGALIVQGGVGIAKDVNISGSLNVTGLLTAVSMSTQYVTSSQYTVGTSRILINDDDNVRFAGISVIDSGSTAGSGSLLWDSVNNHWIYENTADASYNSAILIAGPKNYGSLGDEEGLVAGRIPVATGTDHIDTNAASSSIYIDFSNRRTHVEAGLTVTGSISSSVGFFGDGSNLTGIVTTLNVTGSNDGSNQASSVNLKTQGLIVSASEGIDVTLSGQTLTISGEDATTTNKGIASFNTNNFTVSSGAVSTKAAVVNGVNVILGSSVNISLAEITNASATTSDQIVMNGGAIIHGTLFTSSSVSSIAGPVTNQVVATFATGSYDAAHFDYVIKDGTNYRTGTVMAIWNAAGSVEFTDTSTNDIGNTLDEVFSVDTNAGNVRLKLTTGAGTWTAKTAVRMF